MMKVQLKDEKGEVLTERELVLEKGVGVFHLDRGLIAQAGGAVTFCFRQPIQNIHGYWASTLYRPDYSLPWRVELESAAQRQMPFLVWLDLSGESQASYMLTNLKDDARLVGEMSQSGSEYEMSWRVTLTAETEEFDFVVDMTRRPLPESVAAFRQWVISGLPEIPVAAWEPVYCTWYAFHGAYTIPELEKNGAEAKRLGFGTFILDDGWSYDISKRLNPATLHDWYSEIGGWQVSEKKLPDFGAHVKRMQAMGLNYVLWCAPFLVGQKTGIYRELKERGSILEDIDDGSSRANPADPLMEKQIIPSILKVFEKYGFDGLKIDYVDFVLPDQREPKGRYAYERIASLVKKLRQIKPDALVEFRQRYTTPVMLPLATCFRACDVPFDFFENLQRCCQIRMVLGDGVPVHADPICFHPEESCINVARHMIGSLAGVPMISADLAAIAPRHKAVIQRFIAFYHQHLATYRTGHWQMQYLFSEIAHYSVENDREFIGTIVSSLPEIPKGKDCWLMNLSSQTYELPGEAVDCEGNSCSRLLPGGILHLAGNR